MWDLLLCDNDMTLMCMLQAHLTSRISITVKPDPSDAVQVSLTDYDLECKDEDSKQQLQATLERVRPVKKGHKYATNLYEELRQTCYALCGRVLETAPNKADDHRQTMWEMFGRENVKVPERIRHL